MRRRFRLRYHAEEQPDGTLRATDVADFPITGDMAEFMPSRAFLGGDVDEYSIRSIESKEERLWTEGVDVGAYLENFWDECRMALDYDAAS